MKKKIKSIVIVLSHDYNNRNRNQLRIPKHRRENGVYYATIKYFNQLLIEVREEKLYFRFSFRL